MIEVVIRPDGDLVDFEEWDRYAELMTKLVESKIDRLVVDLLAVNRMSSNYIGSLISTYKAVEEAGNEMKLINVSDKLFELMEMLKLTALMKIERA